jgi:AraC-like DNA-binding protein
MEHIKLFLLVASFLFPLTLSIALFLDSRQNLSRKIMAITLLTTAFLFLCNYLYFQQDYSIYIPIHSLHAGLEFCIFPAVYLYIKSIILPQDKLRKELWHFLPGLMMIVVASYLFYVYTSKEDLSYFLRYNRMGFVFVEFKFKVLIISRYIHLALVAIQGIVYSIAFVRIPKHYDEKLRNEFSNIENFSIDWINKYLLSFALIVATGFLSYAVFPLKGLHEPVIIFVFFIYSAFVCRLGVVSLKQQKVEIDLDEVDLESIPTPVLNGVKDDILVRKLTDYMECKQAFLQPDVSLTSVCTKLGTNRTYLSSLINQQFGVNFNTYINRYRIDYVNEYLKENPNVLCDELAQIGGFGSVSTMKRAMNSPKIMQSTCKK